MSTPATVPDVTSNPQPPLVENPDLGGAARATGTDQAATAITNAVQAPIAGNAEFQNAPQATAMPVDNGRPSLWKSVLMGALGGLAHGGVVGAALGGARAAADPEGFDQQRQIAANQRTLVQRQQEALLQSPPIFTDHVAASMAADATTRSINNGTLSPALQKQNGEMGDGTVADFANFGVHPVAIIPDTPDGGHAALAGFQQTHGSIPPILAVHQSDGTLALFDANQLATDGRVTPFLSAYSEVTGHGELDAEGLSKMQPAAVVKMLNDANQFFHPGAVAAKDLPAKYAYYKSLQDAQTAAGASFPVLDKAVAFLKDQLDENNRNAASVAQTKENIETKGKIAVEQAKPKSTRGDDDPVIAATPDGNVVTTRAQAEAANQFHYKANPDKINATVAGFNDVQVKVNRLAGIDYSNVQTGVAAAMIEAKGIELGVSGTHLPTGRVNAKLYEENLASANPDTRDFVTAYIGAHEAMTQLPRLQTFGQSSRMTQQQMEAAQAQLPQRGDDAGMARQKLNAVQEILDPLRKQVPRMPGASLIPSYREKKSSGAGGSY